jgi:hypothetical protein
MGFMGEPSETQVLRRLRHRATGAADAPTSSHNLYLDVDHVELEFDVNPREMPPYETGEMLLLCYTATVHDSFPLLDKRRVMSEFYAHYSTVGSGRPTPLCDKMRGTLNLVFAIGAVYSHLINATWQADARDHLIYHSRAWSLLLKDNTASAYTHPDLFRIQTTAALALYYLAKGDVNRSYMASGTAVRSAYAFGLHRRDDDPQMPAVQRETNTRIWWALYVLDTTVSTMTGRPSAVVAAHCSAPYPLPIATDELQEAVITGRFGDKHASPSVPFTASATHSPAASSAPHFDQDSFGPNSGTYLKHAAEVHILTTTVLSDLYPGGAMNKSWQQTQEMIPQLLERLEHWAASLPADLSCVTSRSVPSLERTAIGLYYYNAKILITRPCLCRIERRVTQSRESDIFTKTTAQACVDAAKASAALVPGGNDPLGTLQYHLTPWWAMVHILMQAIATILMNILYCAFDPPDDYSDLTVPLKKLMRLLRGMSAANACAERAYANAYNLIGILSTKVDMVRAKTCYPVLPCIPICANIPSS